MNNLKLKEFRENQKLSQRDIAKLLNITQAYYWAWEKGKHIPDGKQILQLCKIFKCTPNDIFGIREVYEVTTMNWDD